VEHGIDEDHIQFDGKVDAERESKDSRAPRIVLGGREDGRCLTGYLDYACHGVNESAPEAGRPKLVPLKRLSDLVDRFGE